VEDLKHWKLVPADIFAKRYCAVYVILVDHKLDTTIFSLIKIQIILWVMLSEARQS
jgi:hypothetical protein